MRGQDHEVQLKSLAKASLGQLLERWAAERSVVVPGRMAGGDCLYGAFDPETFTLDFGRPALPPKSLLLPQLEATFVVEDGQYREVISAAETVLFGLRACDLMAIRQTTHFMTRDRSDVYFSAKSRATATVVLACPGPQCETCFCTTTRSGPCAEQGFDLQLYDLGDTFIVEVATEQGRALLVDVPLGDLDRAEAEQQLGAFREKARNSVAKVGEVEEAMSLLRDGNVKETVWAHFGGKCIVCGGCTFVCPTCTCFNVVDHVVSDANGVRLRSWDACLFAGFTRETSGHNPRPTQASRVQRRHEHKLRYFNREDLEGGLCGCVGCGRCSDYCPVHIGTLEVVKAIAT